MTQRSVWLVTVLLVLAIAAAAVFVLRSDTAQETLELAADAGEVLLREPLHPIRGGTRVLLFALDGVGDDELRGLVDARRMPNLARLLGDRQERDVYAQAYAVPGALSIIPST